VISPHTIRHTTATHLLRSGVDINTIRAWLGHVSIDITNIYAEVDLQRKAEVLAHSNALCTPVTATKRWKDDPSLDHVMVANMSIPSYKYTGQDMLQKLYQPLLERVQRLPGVQSATLLTEVPLGKTFGIMFSFGDGDKSAADARHSKMRVEARAVGPDAQKVFAFRMLRGGYFNDGDTATSLPVFVVNRAVREYEGNDGDPGEFVGKPLVSFRKEGKPAVVIGVLDDDRQVNVAEPSRPEMQVYLPQVTPESMFYEPAEKMAMDLAVRTERDPAAMTPVLRRVMRKASPELANSTFTTMDQVVEDSYGSQQLAARLLEIFGGTALVLCIAGIYGLLAYLVTQRTRELGIRIALGAQRTRLMAMVLRQAGGMLMAGLAAGLLFAYATSRLVSTLLYGVKPHDPWTMAAVTLILLMGGLAAACIPARRAAGVDPMVALRSE